MSQAGNNKKPENQRIAQRQLSHEKILDSATRQFRDRGYHATGISDIMQSAGLTNGGFYSHFESKEALLAGSLSHACDQIRPLWNEGIDSTDPLTRITVMIDRYINVDHRDNPEYGCPVPTLGSEVARQPDHVRAHFEDEMAETVELLAVELSAAGVEESEKKAWALISLCAGSVLLSRTVADKNLADLILTASRELAGQHLDPLATKKVN